jgi:hypothetical protein
MRLGLQEASSTEIRQESRLIDIIQITIPYINAAGVVCEIGVHWGGISYTQPPSTMKFCEVQWIRRRMHSASISAEERKSSPLGSQATRAGFQPERVAAFS